MVKFKVLTILSFFFTLTFFSYSQNTFVKLNAKDHFEKGMSLYEDNMYSAAQNEFEYYLINADNEDKSTIILAEYYSAMASIYLFHTDGENQVKKFVMNYPNHPKALEAYYMLGNFYYREKNYAKAIYYYEKTDPSVLSKKDLAEYEFKLGYSYFSRKAFKEALPHFSSLKNKSNPYKAAVHYYSAYINYELKNYDEALKDVEIASQTDAYKNSTEELRLGIYYQKAQYKKVIDYVNGQKIEKLPPAILLIDADAFFATNNYEDAWTYFVAYESKVSAISDRKILYRMGFSAFKNNEEDKAISYFEKVGIEKDTLTQYSTYYLGALYTKTSQPRFAINAYEQAKQLSFDMRIAEESHWQLIAVLVRQKSYEQAINELKDFIDAYPDSEYIYRAKELITQAYLNTKAYDLAISFIESLPNKSENIKASYQKVSYYQGSEYFVAGNYYQAVQSFRKSNNYPQNEKILAQSYFWMGESYTAGNKYTNAVEAYKQAYALSTREDQWFANLCYGYGYALYNIKDYNLARKRFEEYLSFNNKGLTYQLDAITRLADCNYVLKSYDQAVSNYIKVLNSNSSHKDYILFQLGLVYGLKNNIDKAVSYFDQLINTYKTSSYYDNALFQKALLTLESGNYDKAVEQFSVLISDLPNSNMMPYALSKRAIAYYNLSKYELALVDYRHILRRYITHPVASGALLGLQEVYGIQNKKGDFEEFLAKYKSANPEDKEVATIEYEAAKSLYFNQKYSDAVNAFNNYIENYPDNKLSEEAKYYVADSHFRLNNYQEAKDGFLQVIDDRTSVFYERSISKLAETELALKDYNQSVSYYNELLDLADNERDRYAAYSGLMQIAEIKNNNEEIIKYADLILEKARINTLAITDASLKKGKAYFNQGKYDQAQEAFQQAIATSKDENAAESKYMLALMQYINKAYQKSLDILFSLNKEFSTFDKWIGKSFLLIADNYYAKGEVFQAKATLSSIIENSDSKKLVDEAKIKLVIIEEKEKAELAKSDSLNELNSTDSVFIQEDSIQD